MLRKYKFDCLIKLRYAFTYLQILFSYLKWYTYQAY